MISVDSNRTLEVVLDGAVATNELPVTITWREIGSINNPLNEIYSSNVLTNGATPVTIISAPKVKFTRIADSISVFNNDTNTTTVTLQIRYNNLEWPILSVELAVGSTLTYLGSEGWSVTDKDGGTVIPVPSLPVVNFVNSNTLLDETYDIVIITDTDISVTLPSAVGLDGKEFTVYMQAVGISQILPSAGETIRGTDGFYLEQTNKIQLVSTGSEWI